MTVDSWTYLPPNPPAELPISAYLDPERLLILHIDLYGKRALEVLEREAEVLELHPDTFYAGYWRKYVWLDLKQHGLGRLDVPRPPVLTAEETADALDAIRGHSGAITYTRKKVEFYSELAGVFMKAGVDSEAIDLHQHWHQVFKLLTGEKSLLVTQNRVLR